MAIPPRAGSRVHNPSAATASSMVPTRGRCSSNAAPASIVRGSLRPPSAQLATTFASAPPRRCGGVFDRAEPATAAVVVRAHRQGLLCRGAHGRDAARRWRRAMAGVARADGVDSVGAPTSGFATGPRQCLWRRGCRLPRLIGYGKLSATQR
jgi:hypothetical protein